MHKTAIVTASYVNDFERCRLLCESIDRHVMGDFIHYILVSGRDLALFRALEGARRRIIDERDLLPSWLVALPDPTALMRRQVWLSPFSPPLRGWHVQQLRRMALARQIGETAMLTVDSDVVLIRDFDPATLWQGERLAFYRRPGAIDEDIRSDHLKWLKHSERLLGLPPARLPATDYISSLIPWRTDTCRRLLDHIEARHGRHWVKAMIGTRAFSECIIYGRFVDEVLGGEGHVAMPQALCHSLWFEDSYDRNLSGLRRFVADMAPNQIALQIQSFIGHSIADIRAATAVV
ncbi:DUF6492 family protein [Ensifer soli]|uniref:DUF6492 family protein n=1 Tax=Ciceribacter sp. sgz301302 TaxID=3342379 RepID=UPI0035B7EC4D